MPLSFENLQKTDRAVVNTMLVFNRYLQTHSPSRVIVSRLSEALVPSEVISIVTEYFGNDRSRGLQLVLTRVVSRARRAPRRTTVSLQ